VLAANVTVIAPSAPGDLRFFPANVLAPLASVINFGIGQVRANNAMIPLACDGSGRFMVLNDGEATVGLLVDVVGWLE
jgi:hypothetical protein